jgi:beta-galactosidase GanA
MIKLYILFFLYSLLAFSKAFSQTKFDNVLYGVAYYHEYMPSDRLDKDIQMMKDANITVDVLENLHGVSLKPRKENLNLHGWIAFWIKCIRQGSKSF